jgi:hypothetical protein
LVRGLPSVTAFPRSLPDHLREAVKSRTENRVQQEQKNDQTNPNPVVGTHAANSLDINKIGPK